MWLLLGWVVAYLDRTITGPVISYMIDNDLAFVAEAVNPYALGGLIGSMFFAGYILTQFPRGLLGDRFGHRTIIVISLFWAGIATLLCGLMTGLIVGVSNDCSLTSWPSHDLLPCASCATSPVVRPFYDRAAD